MRRLELIFFSLVLAVSNLTLVSGAVCEPLIFLPEQVAGGQCWRVLTHPFVHVSVYHLLLDGAAFLFLYGQLAESNFWKRLVLFLGCGAGSLAAAWVGLLESSAIGYCGLSGIGHGLMAICLLETLKRESDKSINTVFWLLLLGLIGKCLFEAVSGSMLWGGLHFGSIGVPNPLAHGGGVLGGVVSYWLLSKIRVKEIENAFKRVPQKLRPPQKLFFSFRKSFL